MEGPDIKVLYNKKPERKPAWLKVKLPSSDGYFETKGIVNRLKLNTVCEDSICPNVEECWGARTCTFMILGDICTRHCRFCAVNSGKPLSVDVEEPGRVARAIRDLGIRHAVITSVDRDDLVDGGASIFAETILETRKLSPKTRVEVLTPDFEGNLESAAIVWNASPDVFAHNVETVPSLQSKIRHRATWEVSTKILQNAVRFGLKAKTGIQVGHGETIDELIDSFELISELGVQILTIGQYLRPSMKHRPVMKYYTPEEFKLLADEAKVAGIKFVFSGPLVRSSYKAETVFAGTIANETV